jgi:hypothetical protein
MSELAAAGRREQALALLDQFGTRADNRCPSLPDAAHLSRPALPPPVSSLPLNFPARLYSLPFPPPARLSSRYLLSLSLPIFIL